ncbi:TPA: hypothetical protein O8U17_002531 [Enterobacter asburiae]|nr:hypothetical protein [Enterobacter asburiae]
MFNPLVKLHEDYDVPSQHGMATKHTLKQFTLPDAQIDEDAFATAQATADAINANLNPVYDDIVGMTSTEARIYIEKKYKPLLVTAIHQHKESCDNVEHFESGADSFKATERARYAYELKHPEIQKIACAGATHLQSLMQSGVLNRDGYKLADNRPVTMSLNGVTSQRSTIILIPVTRASLLDYAETVEAKEYAEEVYQRDLKRLLSLRNQSAVKLQELRDKISAKWDSVSDFEGMFRSGIRKGRK